MSQNTKQRIAMMVALRVPCALKSSIRWLNGRGGVHALDERIAEVYAELVAEGAAPPREGTHDAAE